MIKNKLKEKQLKRAKKEKELSILSQEIQDLYFEKRKLNKQIEDKVKSYEKESSKQNGLKFSIKEEQRRLSRLENIDKLKEKYNGNLYKNIDDLDKIIRVRDLTVFEEDVYAFIEYVYPINRLSSKPRKLDNLIAVTGYERQLLESKGIK